MSKIIVNTLLLLSLFVNSFGQSINFQQIDSLSYAQYLNGEWDNLLYTGRVAEKLHIVYPNLSLRLGYAAYMKGNNSLSLKHYDNVLKLNSFNETALYYYTLNNLQLSRKDAALFAGNRLSTPEQNSLRLSFKKPVELIDFETSFKPTNVEIRKTGQYYRIGIGNRINYRWKLYHSFASYRQNMLASDSSIITSRRNNGLNTNSFRKFLVSDFQYYLKSEVYLKDRLSLTNSIHATYTSFDNFRYNTIIFNCAIKYLTPYADFKVELNTGPLLDSLITQLAFSSTYFPKGNINFYGSSRFSFQKRTSLSSINFSQVLVFKIHKHAWLELHGTIGKIKNLIDNNAFYIYDALDAGKFRLGASLHIPFNDRLSLLSNYFFEQKLLYLQNTNYNLHSYTIGLSWKI